jgi:hypothetical protein
VSDITDYESYPSDDNTWTVKVTEGDPTNNNWSLQAFAICAFVSA